MQKKLLTLAVAGALAAPGLALAQASVEVYGTLYPTFGWVKYSEGFTQRDTVPNAAGTAWVANGAAWGARPRGRTGRVDRRPDLRRHGELPAGIRVRDRGAGGRDLRDLAGASGPAVVVAAHTLITCVFKLSTGLVSPMLSHGTKGEHGSGIGLS